MSAQLILSDACGNIFVHPKLKLLGFDGVSNHCPSSEELISLPQGSTLFLMPHHNAYGFDEKSGEEVCVEEFGGGKVFAVSAFIIPGYTRLYLPAALKRKKDSVLPLWPYTAVGWMRGRFYACAVKVDDRRHQMPHYYQDQPRIKREVNIFIKKYPGNRLIQHLCRCALVYNCRNAQNFFLGRWEAPLPVSPACNAKCLGCISYQDSDCMPASHERIRFVPTAQEVSEAALIHLGRARKGMVSFGQGCEGEPLLQFNIVKEAIRLIRKKSSKGTIHLNTNGFCASCIKELAAAGLDSVRVSLNSFDEKRYAAYYRPRGYGLKDVLASVAMAKKCGLFVSLNLLTFPGLTDQPVEAARLVSFLKKGYVDFLQLRNLSIEPSFLIEKMPLLKKKPMSMLLLIKKLRKLDVGCRIGYFNMPKGAFFLWK